MPAGAPDLSFDPDALREKYARERDRRLRRDGIDQYVEIAGQFAWFADDPWADADFTREPIADNVDVAIVGAGFGGLLTGARLRELGVENVRLIDKAADVGGTWYSTATPASRATASRTSTCSCSRRPATSRPRSTPRALRFSPIAVASPNTTICTATRVCRPRFTKSVGTLLTPAGLSPPTAATRSGPGSCRWPTAI